MRTIAIAGVGLIGGSLGLALRKYGWDGTILGVSSPRTIEEALRLGAIHEGVSLEAAAGRADLIYLAQPVGVILDTIDRLGTLVRPGCLITDAGSTKTQIVARARQAFKPAVQFLGGHPLAGKEARGVGAADADLFAGRTYVLTPTYEAELMTPAVRDFMNLLTIIRAVPAVVTAEKHDTVVAFTSHLPQMAATALATVVGTQVQQTQYLHVSGPGLQDSTRLALSSWDVWRDIVQTNVGNIDHALSVYIDKLTEIRENLQTQRLGEEFSIASEAAARIRRVGAINLVRRGERSCE
jgi:prephenate dehydrogenase